MKRFRKARRKLRYGGEIMACAIAEATIPFLPRRALVWLAGRMGSLAFHVSRRDRMIGLANVTLAFGDSLSPRERRAIVLGSFRTFALVMMDVFWFSRKREERFKRYVSVDASGEELLRQAPAILVTAHLSNWELLSQIVASRGGRITSIAKPLANAAVTRRLLRLREASGQDIVPVRGALRHLLRALRRGDFVGVLLDQNTPQSEGGVFVDFFGVPATVSAAVAAMASKTGCRMIPAFCRHDADGAYHGYALQAIEPGEQDERELTQRVAALIESEIRKRPEQWLWMYKRWKRVPPGADRAAYPFYARA